MGMLVDQVADLPHVAHRHQPAVIQEDDRPRDRLDLVEDVAGYQDGAAAPAPVDDGVDQLPTGPRVRARQRLV